ncbi:hypothetical protein fh0823_08270 [Francisella halioticida]|uniref:transposase n=1 Tax=Francisella halioticida TaxID=549298 RepID=UPI001AF0E681|nr:transposase [Francisella halioticida]BCD90688.1 hypothetical protein fh0823_08270 [Francisella halioticida]
MSKKRVTYTADFKAKVIIELLEGDMTVNEIASKYDLLPKNVHNWKQQFLSNACLAFDKSSVVKEYSGEFFRTVFSQKIDVKLSKILSILTLPKYTSAGVL